jgi:hypothetical protein
LGIGFEGFRLGVYGEGFMVKGLWFRGFDFRIQGSELRVHRWGESTTIIRTVVWRNSVVLYTGEI